MATPWTIVLSRLTRRVLVNRGLPVAVAVAIAAATVVAGAVAVAVMVAVAARAVADATDKFNSSFVKKRSSRRALFYFRYVRPQRQRDARLSTKSDQAIRLIERPPQDLDLSSASALRSTITRAAN